MAADVTTDDFRPNGESMVIGEELQRWFNSTKRIFFWVEFRFFFQFFCKKIHRILVKILVVSIHIYWPWKLQNDSIIKNQFKSFFNTLYQFFCTFYSTALKNRSTQLNFLIIQTENFWNKSPIYQSCSKLSERNDTNKIHRVLPLKPKNTSIFRSSRECRFKVSYFDR